MRLRLLTLILLFFYNLQANTLMGQVNNVPVDFSCDINLYSESFESGVPIGWEDLELDQAKLNFFNEGWVIDRDTTFTPNTGPNAAQEGSYYAYCDGSGPIGRGEIATMISPEIVLDKGFRPAMTFYLNMHGRSGSFSLNVLSEGESVEVLAPVSGDIPGGIHGMDQWEKVFINLESYRGKKIQLEFVTMKPQDPQVGDISIDNISICSSSNPIPTMSEWMIISLSISMLIVGVVSIRNCNNTTVQC